ncbi:hypothetical protein K8T06_05990, partial [bacterium]|nr:hypothetical protein [bacterium]
PGWFFHGDVRGIRISADSARIVSLPVFPRSRSISQRRIEMTFDVEGSTKGMMTYSGSGYFDKLMRARFRNRAGNELRMIWEQYFNQAIFPMKIHIISCPNWDDFSEETQFEVSFTAEWAGLITDKMMVVPIPDIPVPGCRRKLYSLNSNRIYPVELAAPCLETLDVIIHLPEDYKPVYMPKDEQINTEYMSMIQHSELSPGQIQFRRQIQWKSSAVDPAEYTNLYQSYARSNSDSENLLILERASE